MKFTGNLTYLKSFGTLIGNLLNRAYQAVSILRLKRIKILTEDCHVTN